MDSPEHPSGQKERELFIQAMEKATPAERAAFPDAACENDTALRRRLELLLERFDPVDTFLEKPVVSLGNANQDPLRAAGEAGPATVVASTMEQAGTVIGRYKLLEKIGEGGMGVVYMAEQEEPVRRRVAFKIITLRATRRRTGSVCSTT
jgi:eukaryotic-like serine/threonine-protein kinase